MKSPPRNDVAADPQTLAEDAAVLRHLIERTPVPEDVARRVDERAERITEGIRRTRGIIDDDTFGSMISDDDET